MDHSPRALARWLFLLAFLLALEGAVSVILGFTVPDAEIFSMIRTYAHLPHVALLIGFAVAIWLMMSGGEARVPAQRLLWGGFLAISATALMRFQDVYVSIGARYALMLHGLGSVLLGIAAPGIWGTALARESDLQNPRTVFAGRAFAVSSVAGFGGYLVAEVIRLYQEWPPSLSGPTAALGTFTVLLFAARASLLWSTFLFWRPPADEIAARNQSRKVQTLMLLWMAASSAALVFSALVGVFESPSTGHGTTLMLLWHAVVQATLTLIVTILVALSLERPALDFEPRRKRSLLTQPLPPPATDNSPIDLPQE